MKKYNNGMFDVQISKEKVTLEFDIKFLVRAFNGKPDGIARVKRGRGEDFASYVMRELIDEGSADTETGASHLSQAFDTLFYDMECDDLGFLKYDDDWRA